MAFKIIALTLVAIGIVTVIGLAIAKKISKQKDNTKEKSDQSTDNKDNETTS